MKNFIVFHDGQIIYEGDTWLTTTTFPRGAYIRFVSGQVHWYFLLAPGSSSPINERDIPNWIRAWCLLL